MSLKLKKTDTFKTRVDVTLADGTSGHFTAEFRYLDRSAADTLMAEGLSDPEFIKRTVVSVQGIEGEDGTPASHDAALAAIAGDIAITGATVRAFWQALGGAPAKNSPTSRAR